MTADDAAPRGPDDRDDLALLRSHVAGDSDAFGELFARHRDRLWAVALRTMGNPTDAADGLQDGLIAAFRRAGSFRGDAAVTTWLHRVVVNACLDRLRAAKVRHTDQLPDEPPEYAGHGFPAPASPTDPADDLVLAERRRAVLSALNLLPAEQRAALVLVDMEGYSVAEAASMLEVAQGTVKSRCARGRAKLAGPLAEFLPSVRPAVPTTLSPPVPTTGTANRNRDPGSAVRSTDSPRGPP
ncbi:MAG: RNA polymerase sigma factor SigM [Nocardioides sp.]